VFLHIKRRNATEDFSSHQGIIYWIQVQLMQKEKFSEPFDILIVVGQDRIFSQMPLILDLDSIM
jgi:hypothetical protein